MQREEDRVHELMEDVSAGNDVGNKMVYDPHTKTVRPSSHVRDPDKGISITPKDMEHFFSGVGDPVIILADYLIDGNPHGQNTRALRLASWDNGAVFSTYILNDGANCVQGSITRVPDPGQTAAETEGLVDDIVRVFAPTTPPAQSDQPCPESDAKFSVQVRGHVFRNSSWIPAPVQIVTARQELTSRFSGLFETDILSDKEVFIAGQGSGGAPIALELAKQGVNISIIDHDRLEAGNITRHPAGLSNVGRYKVDVMSELIRDKNPFIRINTSRSKVSRETTDEVRSFVRRADLVICGIDEPDGRKLLNRICIEENKPLLVAGVFRRAHGGQVLRVRPRRTPCYQCFLMSLPDVARNQEISGLRDAMRLAYSDRVVKPEPGLSNDISPVSTMVVTLSIQLLLEGKSTALRSRDEDLVAPWYLWLNRREPETDYAKLDPLEFNIDGMHILRWYGIALARRADCPCCGDFVEQSAGETGTSVTPEEADAFR